MASNGGFFPAERLVWDAEAKLLCDAIFGQSTSEVRIKSSFDRIQPIKVDHWKGSQNN
jgi:hypothetical protein